MLTTILNELSREYKNSKFIPILTNSYLETYLNGLNYIFRHARIKSK